MLEVTVTASTFEDMAEAQKVLNTLSTANYRYGPDKQSYEFNMDAQQLVVRNNGRLARSGLGLYGNCLEDLQAPKASTEAHTAAIQEINSALQSMNVEPVNITQVVAMFQPYTAYVEMEAAGVKILMTYAKSWSAGTGHRRLTAKGHNKIEDSSTHGEYLVRWLEGVLDRKAADPRFLLKVAASPELITDEMLATVSASTGWDTPEDKLKRKVERQIERINKQQIDCITQFTTRGKEGWLTAREQDKPYNERKQIRSEIAYKFNTAAERDAAFERAQADLPGFLLDRQDLE